MRRKEEPLSRHQRPQPSAKSSDQSSSKAFTPSAATSTAVEATIKPKKVGRCSRLQRSLNADGQLKSQPMTQSRLALPSTTPTKAPKADPGSRTWSCPACTFVNDVDHGRCAICLAKPDGTRPSDVDDPNMMI